MLIINRPQMAGNLIPTNVEIPSTCMHVFILKQSQLMCMWSQLSLEINRL